MIREGWPRLTTIALACALLTSCSTTPPPEPEVRIVEVTVPVAVSCVPPTVTIEPDFQITRADVLAASDEAERYRIVAAGFLERDAYVALMRPVLEGCQNAAEPVQ